VSLDSVAPFIQAGAAAVGVGGEIVSAKLLARRAFPEITARARAFVEAVKSARERPVPSAPPIKPIEGPDTR
jgi:2-dehydro-3-deoxyphosphogluconate aldolase/(4S)-4-hydroxy-2-oxoglutarate aldolase